MKLEPGELEAQGSSLNTMDIVRPNSLPDKGWKRDLTSAVDIPSIPGNRDRRKKKRIRPPFSQYKMTFDTQYTLNGLLGKGAGSSVYGCLEKRSGEEYAVKIVRPDTQSHRKRLLKEIEILHICADHPHVIDMKEYFEENDRFFLIYQKMDGGPLLEHIARRRYFSEAEARAVTTEIGDALHFLHNKGIAHRDLKPANILCERQDAVTPVRICDFDLGSAVPKASLVTTPVLQTPVGSCEFMAPEVVAAFADDDLTYDKKCDMWSLGVILYIMLCGSPPFKGYCGDDDCSWESGGECFTCQTELLQNIRTGQYSFSGREWHFVSRAAKDLIRQLLVKDAALRYNTDQLRNHPFITQEICSAQPLATPSVLKRCCSAGSLGFFPANALEAVRQLQLSQDQRPPVWECSASEEELPVGSTSSDRSSDCFDLKSPDSSALAQRRGHRRSSPPSIISDFNGFHQP